MKILIAEDERGTALAIERQLSKAGYQCDVASNGVEALRLFEATDKAYDVLVTDWMMPEMDGVELIERVRKKTTPSPIIIMATSLDSEESMAQALDAGADAYLTKPVSNLQLLECLQQCFNRRDQEAPKAAPRPVKPTGRTVVPPCIAVAMAASTGGPDTLVKLFEKYTPSPDVVSFLVLHGPGWMLETFATRLDKLLSIGVQVGEDGAPVAPGQLYIAPGDRHLAVSSTGRRLRVLDEPQENFVRPAADPLFRSVAQAYGHYALGVVLTGLGHDGALGSEAIVAAGGHVVVQDPASAVAPPMPRSVVDLGIASAIQPIDALGAEISKRTASLSEALHAARAGT